MKHEQISANRPAAIGQATSFNLRGAAFPRGRSSEGFEAAFGTSKRKDILRATHLLDQPGGGQIVSHW